MKAVSWGTFAAQAPELAAFGAARFASRVAYLATLRADGAPRVHPVTPIIGHGRLFVFMEPTSPKGHDLRRDGRFALHNGVENADGGAGEFSLSGEARFVEDAETRALAVSASSYAPKDRYVLFELCPARAASTLYQNDQPVRMKWELSE